jgi:hypothetical protein
MPTEERTIRAHALEAVVMDRIHTLWGYRKWYREHNGWLVQDRVEHTAELRYLLQIVRKSRALAAPAIERADDVTAAKHAAAARAATWADRDGDHLAYPEDFNVEGEPAFNGAFR